MSELASSGQLRMSFLRVALVVVPLVLLLGILSAALSGSGGANLWYRALQKPAGTPPDAVFAGVWSLLYVMMGFALSHILFARGARGRGTAIALFAVQLALNLAWSPTFFAEHAIGAAFAILLMTVLAATGTTVLFWRIRRNAGLLMLPYLVWLCFAGWLNHAIDTLNPGAGTLAPGAASTQVQL